MSEDLKKYKLVKINPDNYQFIQQLYKDCFNLKQTIAEIEEKYNTSEFNIRDIGFLAFDGNQPAAYYGIFPIVAEYNGQDFQIAQTGDVMTSPNYRKKGLFTFLAKKIHLLAKEYGIELIYGFPNKNSTPGFKRNLEWQFYGTLQNFNFKIDVFPFSELEIKSRFFKPFYSFLLKRKVSKYQIPLSETEIPTFNNPTNYIKIKKDIHFFKYKSGRRRYLIKYRGFELFIKVNVNLQIGDVVFFDKDKTDQFIDAIQELAKELGCRSAMLAVSPNHWLFDYLKGKINPEEGLPIGGIELSDVISLKNFAFTFADHDIF